MCITSFEKVLYIKRMTEIKLKSGETYFFYGRVEVKYGMISMTNPVFEPIDKNYRLKGYMPVYTVKGNLTQSAMKTMCQKMEGAESTSYKKQKFPSNNQSLERYTNRCKMSGYLCRLL